MAPVGSTRASQTGWRRGESSFARPTAFCPKKGCSGTCPISAVVAGFYKNDRAKCRECGTAYPKPADVYFWQYPKKDKPEPRTQTGPAATTSADKQIQALKQELQQAKRKLQEVTTNKDNQQDAERAPPDGDNDEVPDLDKQIADINTCISTLRTCRPDDPHIEQLEKELATLRAKKQQGKPLATRQLQVAKRLEKARAARTTLLEAQEAEKTRHKEAMDKLVADMQKAEEQIQTLETEHQEIVKEVAGQTIQKGDPQRVVAAFLDDFIKAIPNTVTLQPQGMSCLEAIKQNFSQLITQMQEAAKTAEAATANVQTAIAPQHQRDMGNIDVEDGDCQMDDDQLEQLSREEIGEHDPDAESEERWQQRIQTQKASTKRVALATIKSLKLKQAKKHT